MRQETRRIGTAAAALAGALSIGGGLWAAAPVATATSTLTFAVDSRGATRTLTSAAEVNAILPVNFRGSSVTVTDPTTGATTALDSPAWRPTWDGTWTLRLGTSPAQTATFRVNYGVFQTGAGTAAKPYVVKYQAELNNYTADGVYFTFSGTFAIDTIAVPTGYVLESAGGGAYILRQWADYARLKYISEASSATFAIDSLPNPRTVRKAEVLPLAYRPGATVKVTSPAEATLVSAAASAGTYAWTAGAEGTAYTLTHAADSQTWTATFNLSATAQHYTITWRDGVNEAAWAVSRVASGAVPGHAYPTRPPADAQYAWVCTGWDPAPAAATADATYTAQWRQALRSYTVTFYNGGSILSTQQMPYNTATALKPIAQMNTASCPKAAYGWTFAGWSTANNNTAIASADGANRTLTADLKLYAVYRRTFTYTYFATATATAMTTATLTQWWRTGAAQAVSFPRNFADTAYDILIDGDAVLKSGVTAAVSLTPAADQPLTAARVRFGALLDIDTRANPRTAVTGDVLPPVTAFGAATVIITNTVAEVGETRTFEASGAFDWSPTAHGAWTLTHSSSALSATATFNAVEFLAPYTYLYYNQGDIKAISSLPNPTKDGQGRVHVKAAE